MVGVTRIVACPVCPERIIKVLGLAVTTYVGAEVTVSVPLTKEKT